MEIFKSFKASSFLLHPPEISIQGQVALSFSIEALRERLESLQQDEIKMAEVIGERIGKDKKEILKMFKERKTYSSTDAKTKGFIQEIEEFVAEPGLPIFTITNQG